MIISFVTSGFRTTTQDLGRRGYTHLGIPVGGVLDTPAMRYANQLVGNPINTPVLEITLSGPQLVCEQAGSIAMTGANFGVHINGEEKPSNARIVLAAGDTISFPSLKKVVAGILQLRAIGRLSDGLAVPVHFVSVARNSYPMPCGKQATTS